MRKVIGLLAIVLIGCSADPLPSEIKLFGDSTHYAIDWDSNQQNSVATYIIYKQGVGFNTDVKSKHFEIDIPKGTIFRFFVRDTTVRPLCTITISKRKPMDLSSGVYNPNDYIKLFEDSKPVNYYSFGARVIENGKLKID